ncbi:ead/Ea22-like family protein [Pseudomonas vlassakiae]|uniref:ead/Ea22-like family protein n=1 Tax=Pseudomonas vlassakiae TaxID=485888 RepID=UPI003D28A5B5
MTIDKEKLKALAEAATPGRHYDRLESAGGGIKYECAGDDGSLVLKVDHKNNEFGFVGDRGEADEAFFLACSPAAVLALLAEIERLESAKGDPVGSFDKHMEYMQENIRLKAENEALRKDAERYRFVRNPIGTSSPLAIWNEGKMPLFSGMADAVVDEYMAKELTNKGHGHVFPRHDGVKAKCGGPGLCAECAADQQAKEASHG